MLTAAAFLAAFLTGCFLSLFHRPIFGLATYVSLVYVHPPSSWWGSILPSLRWSLLAAAVTLVSIALHKSKQVKPRLLGFGLIPGLVVFSLWLVVQSAWAMDETMHRELIVIFFKYTLLTALVYYCIQSTRDLKIFLWTHAAGCFYLGTVVLYEYTGGRFEGFRGPGIDEANAAGLLIVTGVITTFILFLSGNLKEKIISVGFMPVTLNGLVATISRSGFLALVVAGTLFNLFAPKKHVATIRVFSVLGLILLVLITNPVYWQRIATVLEAGEQIEGVDTGSSRVVLIKKQFEMFADYPMGCGHRCTANLSRIYLEDRYLTGAPGRRARSSHNTFMSLIVEQGIPGAILYVGLLYWIARNALRLRHEMRNQTGLIPLTYVATVSILGAITVGDMFVDYLKFEARFWFLGILMVLVGFGAEKSTGERHESMQAVRT